uniref:Uncharacterized protein n=1 Tax=Rhizophagus irregularis (strain DAOM 181602 / DAOM 197198 / MUCL 43194) TaxID=747089 RepID=U9U0S4_RHIID
MGLPGQESKEVERNENYPLGSFYKRKSVNIFCLESERHILSTIVTQDAKMTTTIWIITVI